MKRGLALAGALLLVGNVAPPAMADSWWKYWLQDWAIRRDSDSGLISPETERQALEANDKKYYDQHPNLRYQIGVITIGGQVGISDALVGQTVDLTFAFLEPGGPQVYGVRYEANLDPMLDPLLPGSMQLLGTSYDAGTQFSFPWTVAGYEPLILATPLDQNGNPIYTADYVVTSDPNANRDNISVAMGTIIPVPAPSAVVGGLVLMGVLAWGGARRVRAVV